MMEPEVLKKAIDKFPIIGDVVSKIEEDKVIYKSGHELSIKGKTSLSINDKVKSVYQEFDEEKGELFIGISHTTSSDISWVDKTLHSELINLQRRMKIEEIMEE